jgi:hypothetical protein
MNQNKNNEVNDSEYDDDDDDDEVETSYNFNSSLAPNVFKDYNGQNVISSLDRLCSKLNNFQLDSNKNHFENNVKLNISNIIQTSLNQFEFKNSNNNNESFEDSISSNELRSAPVSPLVTARESIVNLEDNEDDCNSEGNIDILDGISHDDVEEGLILNNNDDLTDDSSDNSANVNGKLGYEKARYVDNNKYDDNYDDDDYNNDNNRNDNNSVIDDWDGDDDNGYIIIEIDEKEFFAMENEISQYLAVNSNLQQDIDSWLVASSMMRKRRDSELRESMLFEQQSFKRNQQANNGNSLCEMHEHTSKKLTLPEDDDDEDDEDDDDECTPLH